jgi:hypothetical protein
LAVALNRSGKRDAAQEEFAKYKQVSSQAEHLTHEVQQAVLGPQKAETAEPF